ncbi:MAG: hypothetical protein L3J24_02850 [Xanthomonadales bacterium]|nr:hypothetical protein [Xanthomonadales bacterium]
MFSANLLADQSIADQYPGSLLYSKPVEVIPHVWSAIGATAAPNYANAGHNNNLSFIVTTDGVVVLNSGAAISALIESGEDLQAAYELDQSQFSHLHIFKELAAKNAGRVFEHMEFE